MLQYIVQVRHMRAANTQTNSTIKHISFYHVSYQSHLKICHQHKLATLFITLIKHLISQTRAFQVLVSGSPKRNLNWKIQGIFWITKVFTWLFNFCKFFGTKYLQKQGSVSRVWAWIQDQFLEDAIYYLFSPQWLWGLHKGGLIQKYNSAVHTT